MQDKTTVAKEILTDICITMDGESYDHVNLKRLISPKLKHFIYLLS